MCLLIPSFITNRSATPCGTEVVISHGSCFREVWIRCLFNGIFQKADLCTSMTWIPLKNGNIYLSYTIESLPSTSPFSEDNTQIVNPPFVFSLDISESGRLLAAGLGDGNVLLLDTLSNIPVCLLKEKTSLSVSQVYVYPPLQQNNINWMHHEGGFLSSHQRGMYYPEGMEIISCCGTSVVFLVPLGSTQSLTERLWRDIGNIADKVKAQSETRGKNTRGGKKGDQKDSTSEVSTHRARNFSFFTRSNFISAAANIRHRLLSSVTDSASQQVKLVMHKYSWWEPNICSRSNIQYNNIWCCPLKTLDWPLPKTCNTREMFLGRIGCSAKKKKTDAFRCEACRDL